MRPTKNNKKKTSINRKKKKSFSVIFTTKNTTRSEQIKKIIHQHWHILQSDERLASLYDPPLMVFKCEGNLRDYLVRSDLFPPSLTNQMTLTPIPEGNCRWGSCNQCNYTHHCTSFKHPHTGKSIPIKGIISCTTKAVIYLITCPYGKSYVGKTSRELKTCIAEHRSTIRCKNMNYPLAVHFLDFNHPITSLRYTGIMKISSLRRGGDLDQILFKKEAFWIHKLKMLTPYGLNVDFDLSCFL